MAIISYLEVGADNAKTKRELSAATGYSLRMIDRMISAERHMGVPICSNSRGPKPGYFLAGNKEEMRRFCEALHHRASAIYSTRRACQKTIDDLPGI